MKYSKNLGDDHLGGLTRSKHGGSRHDLRSGALRRLRLSVAAQNQDLLRKQNRANLTATQFEAERGVDECDGKI